MESPDSRASSLASGGGSATAGQASCPKAGAQMESKSGKNSNLQASQRSASRPEWRTLIVALTLAAVCIQIDPSQQQLRAAPHLAPHLRPPPAQQQQQQLISTAQSSVNPFRLQQQSPRMQPAASRARQQQQRAGQPLGMSQGPGVDLVALNWRRFELEHKHHAEAAAVGADGDLNSDSFADGLKRAELIESQWAAIPERLLSRLPDEVSKQLIESLAADPSLLFESRTESAEAAGALETTASSASPAGQEPSEDPDGASIERLTKSCLSVQASSLTADQLNVTFHLYTRRNPSRSFIVRPQASRQELLQAAGSPFDARKPLKWITHGFHTNLDKSEWMLEAKDKILLHEDANVFLTDWRRGASPALAFYPKAAANAHLVARMIVKILRRLWTDINLSQVHLIGHSLGAHIMGFVGSAFTEEFLHKQQQQQQALAAAPRVNPEGTVEAADNQLIGRITACDPALPCFGPSSQAPNSKMSGSLTMQAVGGAKFKRPTGGLDRFGLNRRFRRQAQRQQQQQQQQPPPLESRDHLLPAGLLADDWTPAMWTHLRPDSAILVEVMHSNPGVMGYAEPLGDFDFYPNGSERQPGCSGGGGGGGGGAAGEQAPLTAASTQSTPSTGRQLLRQDQASLSARARASTNMIDKRQFGLVGSIMQTVADRSQQQITRATAGQLAGGADLARRLGQLMKPIRDFFRAYTCSHHRSVEYMVDSMYYEQIPPSKRLDKELVCQMVGYRCADYQAFKLGHCFMCRNELECLSFAMSGAHESSLFSAPAASEQLRMAVEQPLAAHFPREHLASLATNAADLERQRLKPLPLDSPPPPPPSTGRQMAALLRQKRILPTLTQYKQNYKPIQRNRYYFDTKPARNFCLHHYHLLVKYRWFRVRESVPIDRLRLGGSLDDLLTQRPVTFNKFTHQAYTMLLTHADFLGQIESLILYNSNGDRLKSAYIEHIDVTYMSNIDPQVRATNSARLCRANQNNQRQQQLNVELSRLLGVTSGGDQNRKWTTDLILFVRCTQEHLLVR